jgi:hypothetical protein
MIRVLLAFLPFVFLAMHMTNAAWLLDAIAQTGTLKYNPAYR